MSRDEVLALVAHLDPGARIAFRDDGPPMVIPSAAITTDGAAELMRAVLGVRLSFGPDSPRWSHMLEAMRSLRTSGLPEPMRAASSYELDDLNDDGPWKSGRPPEGWGKLH